MTPLDAFLPDVLPFANGASYIAAINAVRSAAIDFSKRTRVIRDWLPDLTPMADEPIVRLATNSLDLEVYMVDAVWLNGVQLRPHSDVHMRESQIDGEQPGTPWFFRIDVDGSIELVPRPHQQFTNGLRVRASLMPTRGAMQVPDQLFRLYSTEIAYGALERLHMADEAYAKPEAAAAWGEKFTTGIGVASERAVRGDTRSPRRVRPCWT
jgi:hypothetical protein